MSINNRIAELRKLMKESKVDAYIVPSSDAHQSEYVPSYYRGRAWISGFTGSAGTAIVTQDHAGLWTDSRYFLQAERELSESEFQLHKLDGTKESTYPAWLSENMEEGSVIGFDPKTITLEQRRVLEKDLPEGIKFFTKYDFLEKIWHDRPSLPQENAYEFPSSMSGETRTERIGKMRARLEEYDADFLLVPTLDDIAWIFNLRGNDVAFNPVTVSYALIAREESHLFINEAKLKPVFADRLMNDNIQIHAYSEIGKFLQALEQDEVLILDPKLTSIYLAEKIEVKTIEKPLLSRSLKAIKNDTEIEHIKNAMIKDGVALTKAFLWLEKTLDERTVTEHEFSEKLAECRATQKDYKGESFNAIIGYKGNGAIVHYSPSPDGSAEIHKSGILLCDSGGHYLDGTTDITRTIPLSTPSVDMQKHYTLVLKGHIDLSTAIFPEGTRGVQLDTLARRHLWNEGLNYGHGTGHGVGFFLNVHEPPQGFTAALDQRGTTVLKPGMLSSDEPGFYLEGEYGIRIENLILCKKSDYSGFLKHQAVTLFPIDTELIYMDWMTHKELKWLNAYHRKVKRLLTPFLNAEEKAWIEKKCATINIPS